MSFTSYEICLSKDHSTDSISTVSKFAYSSKMPHIDGNVMGRTQGLPWLSLQEFNFLDCKLHTFCPNLLFFVVLQLTQTNRAQFAIFYDFSRFSVTVATPNMLVLWTPLTIIYLHDNSTYKIIKRENYPS